MVSRRFLDLYGPAEEIQDHMRGCCRHIQTIVVPGEGKDIQFEEEIGAATFALGLTECCARRRKGKVYFFAKDRFPGDSVPKYLPQSYAQLPGLLYVDYVWDLESEEQWFGMTHVERMDNLNARNGALDPRVPCMPITFLDSEDTDVTTKRFRFYDGIASIILTNEYGGTYLARLSDIARAKRSTRHEASDSDILQGRRSYHECKNPDKYRINDGRDAIENLEKWYQAAIPGSIWLFRSVLVKWSESFDDWKANGGHRILYNSALGDELVVEARRLTAEFYHRDCAYPRVTAGIELQDIEKKMGSWKDDKRHAWHRLIVAADQGVYAKKYIIGYDAKFCGLVEDDRKELVRMLELKQEEFRGLSDDDIQSYRETWGKNYPEEEVPEDPVERNEYFQSKRKRLGRLETE